MRALALILAVAFLLAAAGCKPLIEKDAVAVKAEAKTGTAQADTNQQATSGDQQAKGQKNVQIGAVNVSGSTVVGFSVCVVVILYLWWSRNGYRRVSHGLVREQVTDGSVPAEWDGFRRKVERDVRKTDQRIARRDAERVMKKR